MNLICRFCGKKAKSARLMVELLDSEIDEDTPEPSLLQKIDACIPIKIDSADAAPKNICSDCCRKTHDTYEFIQMVLITQKVFDAKSNESVRSTVRSVRQRETKRNRSDSHTEEVEVVDEEIYTETNANATKVIYDVLKRLQSSGNGITIKRKTIPTADTNKSSNDHIEPTANEPTIDEETPDTNIEILEELEPVDISDPDFYTDDKLTPITKPKKSSSKTIVLNVEAPPIYICLLCQSKFSSFEALAAHMKNNRHCKEISQKCDKCGKVFDTRKSLQQHLQTHKDKPTLVCEQCGKTFAHQFSLDNHKSSQHGEYVEEIMDSIYRCKECDAHFTNRRELYEHISKHTKVPTPVLCDYCGRSFKSSDSLRSHMRCHQNVRPFPCTFCDRRFRSRLQMQQHLHVHTGVKLFKCQYCDREFAKKDSLVAHTRTHTGELPYPCSHCEMKFATLSKRKTHCRLQHARETPDADEVKEDMPQTNENSANIFIEHTIETHSGIAVGDIQPLSSTTTPYVTYSTAFIDSDNILVFETPVDADMPLDDMLSGASSLDVIQ